MKILIKLTESQRKVGGKVYVHLITDSVSPLVIGILDKALGLITFAIIEVVVYPVVISCKFWEMELSKDDLIQVLPLQIQFLTSP